MNHLVDRDPLFIVVCLTVAFAPFTGINVVFFLSFSDLFLLLGTGLLLLRFARGTALELPRPTLFVLVAASLFLIVQIVVLPRATDTVIAAQWVRTYIGVLLLFLLIVTTVDSREKLEFMLKRLTLAILIVGILTVIHSLYGVVPFGDRFHASRSIFGFEIPFRRTLGVPMDYGNHGLYMSLATGYLLYEWFENRHTIAILALPIPLLAAFISQSRASWAAVGVVLVIYFFYRMYQELPESDSIRTVTMGVTGSVFTVLGVMAGRMLIRINPLTLRTRISAILDALQAFQRKPILGVGRYSYYLEYSSGAIQQEVIHNGFISVLVSFGIVGFALFAYVYSKSALVLVRSWARSESGYMPVALFAILAGMTVNIMFFDGTYTKSLWILFATIHVSAFSE